MQIETANGKLHVLSDNGMLWHENTVMCNVFYSISMLVYQVSIKSNIFLYNASYKVNSNKVWLIWEVDCDES